MTEPHYVAVKYGGDNEIINGVQNGRFQVGGNGEMVHPILLYSDRLRENMSVLFAT